jgi:hypothetical protein
MKKQEKTESKIVGGEPSPAQLVKKMHMHIGVDLIGSKTSLAASKHLVLTLTDLGVHANSSVSGRKILIPFSNIKGIELF